MKTNKYTRRMDLCVRLMRLGFTMEEADKLRRIEKTLHRWAEHECNGVIQRHEEDDLPYYHGVCGERRIADRERGALKRLEAIVAGVNQRMLADAIKDGTAHLTVHPLWFYHQTDPRGCSVFVGRKSDLRPDQEPESCYSSVGVAVAD